MTRHYADLAVAARGESDWSSAVVHPARFPCGAGAGARQDRVSLLAFDGWRSVVDLRRSTKRAPKIASIEAYALCLISRRADIGFDKRFSFAAGARTMIERRPQPEPNQWRGSVRPGAAGERGPKLQGTRHDQLDDLDAALSNGAGVGIGRYRSTRSCDGAALLWEARDCCADRELVRDGLRRAPA